MKVACISQEESDTQLKKQAAHQWRSTCPKPKIGSILARARPTSRRLFRRSCSDRISKLPCSQKLFGARCPAILSRNLRRQSHGKPGSKSSALFDAPFLEPSLCGGFLLFHTEINSMTNATYPFNISQLRCVREKQILSSDTLRLSGCHTISQTSPAGRPTPEHPSAPQFRSPPAFRSCCHALLDKGANPRLMLDERRSAIHGQQAEIE